MNVLNKLFLLLTMSLALSACSGDATTPSNTDSITSESAKIKTSKIRELLLDRNFEELNRELDYCINNLSVSKEIECIQIYSDAVNQTADIQESLKIWNKQQPNNYHAIIFQSSNLSQLAWVHRGHSFTSYISEFRLFEFKKMLVESINNSKTAYRLNADLPYSYYFIIDAMGRMSSDEIKLERVRWLAKAKKNVPYSITIPKIDLYTSQLRWGGSYNEMQNVIDDYDQRTNSIEGVKVLNNELKLIRADDLADDGFGDKDIELSKRLLFQLLSDEYDKGRVYKQLSLLTDDVNDAINYRNLARNFRPFNEVVLYAAIDHIDIKDETYSLAQFDNYLNEYPNSYLMWRRLAYYQLSIGDLDGVMESLLKAKLLEPDQPEMDQLIEYIHSPETYDYTTLSEEWYVEKIAYVFPKKYLIKVFENAIDLEPSWFDLNVETKNELKKEIVKIFNYKSVEAVLMKKIKTMELSKQDLNNILIVLADASNVKLFTSSKYIESNEELKNNEKIKDVIQEMTTSFRQFEQEFSESIVRILKKDSQ